MSEKGQFLTPINVVRFMLWAVQADKIAIKRIKEDSIYEKYKIDLAQKALKKK